MVWIFSKCWLATVNEWWAGTCIFFNLFSVLISHRQYLAWGLVKFSTYLLSQSATVNIWLGDLWKFQLICWVNQSATVNIWLGDLWNFQLISILDSHLQYLAAGADEDANLSKVTLPVAQVAASKWISTCSFFSQRPYHAECTSSRPITEVKQHWALLVLGWVTAISDF